MSRERLKLPQCDTTLIHQSGVLIFCEKSVFFSFQSILKQLIRFLKFPAYSRNRQDKLGLRRFLKMIDKPWIGVLK